MPEDPNPARTPEEPKLPSVGELVNALEAHPELLMQLVKRLKHMVDRDQITIASPWAPRFQGQLETFGWERTDPFGNAVAGIHEREREGDFWWEILTDPTDRGRTGTVHEAEEAADAVLRERGWALLRPEGDKFTKFGGVDISDALKDVLKTQHVGANDTYGR